MKWVGFVEIDSRILGINGPRIETTLEDADTSQGGT
jgi:hypothetical protein